MSHEENAFPKILVSYQGSSMFIDQETADRHGLTYGQAIRDEETFWQVLGETAHRGILRCRAAIERN